MERQRAACAVDWENNRSQSSVKSCGIGFQAKGTASMEAPRRRETISVFSELTRSQGGWRTANGRRRNQKTEEDPAPLRTSANPDACLPLWAKPWCQTDPRSYSDLTSYSPIALGMSSHSSEPPSPHLPNRNYMGTIYSLSM